MRSRASRRFGASGRRGAIVPLGPGVSFRASRPELAARGAPPEKAFASEKFYGSVKDAAMAVVNREADLCTCFVSDAARDPERAAGEIRTALGDAAAKLRVLHVTDPIPPDGFVVAARVSDEERSAIATALLG